MFMASSSDLRGDFGGVKRGSEPLLFAVISCAIPKARPSDAGRAMPADDLPVGVLADNVVEEQVLGNDGIAFHTHHLGDVGDAAGAAAQAPGLGHDLERGAGPLAGGA